MITRNLNRWVDGNPDREAVRRTITEMGVQIDSLRQQLATMMPVRSNGNAPLSPIQLQQVAGLIAGRSQAVFGLDVQDPQLPGQLGGGTVTSITVTAGTNLTGGGTITTTGTITLNLSANPSVTTVDASTSYKISGTKVVGAQGAAVADVASPNATDLPSVITLANEIKAQLNAWLARARAATGHGLIA